VTYRRNSVPISRFGNVTDRLELLYDVSHNLAKLETHVVDRERRQLCVHRCRPPTRTLRESPR